MDRGRDRFLIVLSGAAGRRILLPEEGEVCIGPEGEVGSRCPEEEGAEGAFLRVHCQRDRVSLEGGKRTLLLNDEGVTHRRDLFHGDLIRMGGVLMTFQDRRRVERTILAPEAFRQRLHQEAERSLREARSLAVLVVLFDPSGEEVGRKELLDLVRQVDVVGHIGPSEVGIVLPGTGAECRIPAQRLVERLSRSLPGIRVGHALSPTDGILPEALLAGARLAAREARPGEVAGVESRVRCQSLGRETVVLVDPAMHQLFDLVGKLAPGDLPVLILGETGTGKELVALALHEMSPRKGRPFVAINCAAIAETLFESELFGHEKGAFTDAREARRGLLEAADGGTVFLDEIGECSLALQAKLLRVVETHRVSRVGSAVERPVDIRIVAASNRDLEAEVSAGGFRRDLYFRLRAASLFVPPLRDRPLDIPVLARFFLQGASGGRPLRLSDGALRRILLHDWPGNVRELKNLMGFCAAVVSGAEVRGEDLPPFVAQQTAPWLVPKTPGEGDVGRTGVAPSGEKVAGTFRPLREEIRVLEETRIREALRFTGGVRVEAARVLGIPLRTLVQRIQAYGISIPSSRRRHPPSAGG